ncbi:hypothetical protein I215_01838 [Galbibacter marinus]|uniref:Uncharacterized protein n=1 Tax=Galbibacter marinus TaxID=555500 RepID=K2PXS5_9FLAO|nr:hypothetical protein [Galbibacter marinus]EKF56224.1 hypothetical protein I215_01838 [Galbibacter marinus]
MACTDTIATENLEYCPSDEIASGVSETEVYACPLSDFLTIGAPPKLGEATTLEEAGSISAESSHTFAEGKGFHKLMLKPDSGNVVSTPQGSKGNITFENKFTAAIPGGTKKTVGWVRKYKGVPMIFIIVEKDGTQRQLGSKLSPSYMNTDSGYASGAAPGDDKITTVSFSDVQPYIAPVYEGTITEFTPPTP